MRTFFGLYLPTLLFIGVSILLLFWDAPINILTELVNESSALSYIVFTSLLFLATVFMPVTVLPIIPIAASVLGPFTTGVLSIIGWTSGALVAFLVARYLGRPILQRFVSLEKIDETAEKIPEGAQFFIIVLLRLTIPVDLASYAVGLTSSIGVIPYTLATMIGVTWFSFAFAYMGDAFFEGDIRLLVFFGALSIIIFTLGWYILMRSHRKK